MQYLNQYSYRHIPYHTRVSLPDTPAEKKLSSVAASGCGLCCACMVVELLTNFTLPIEDCVKISEESLANHSIGTDMKVLGPIIANKYKLEYSHTNDLGEAIRHLQNGGKIIAHVGVPEGKEIGLFTKRGHYITLISTDGKDFCILDPSYTADKFTTPEREGKVDTSHAPYLYCDVNIVDGEGRVGKDEYHLFSRKR